MAPKALSSYTLADPETQKCPFPYYALMRSADPVHRDPGTGWYFITRYDDVVAAFQDFATFSSTAVPMFRTKFQPETNRVLAEADVAVVNTFTTSDPPDAFDFHHIGMRLFPPKKIKELEPRINAIVQELIDGFIARGEVHVAREFTRRVVGTVVAGELGLPLEDLDQFKLWAECTGELMKVNITAEEEVRAIRKMINLVHYLRPRLERAKRGDMEGTAIHTIATMSKKDGTPFSDNQRCWMTFLTFTGGNNTTVFMLNNLILRLAMNPTLQDDLRRHPAKVDGFVEEMLRLEGAAQSVVRRVTRDVEIAGTLIPQGSFVLLSLGSANRDSRQWGENAEELDLSRPDSRRHLSFGTGLHSCIGMHLARAEFRAVIHGLLRRMKNFRLKDAANPPEFLPMTFFHALLEYELAFDRAD